jgi:Rrf2 family protein
MKSTTIIALNILKFLADQKKQVPMMRIASEIGCSRDYVEQICRPLREGGVIKTIQGRLGGIELEQKPETITVQRVVDLFEAHSPHRNEAIDYIDEQIRELLFGISIYQLTLISRLEKI